MLQIIPTNAEQKQHLNDHNIHSKHSPKPVVSPMASSAASFLVKIKNKNPELEITGSSVAQQEEIKAKLTQLNVSLVLMRFNFGV